MTTLLVIVWVVCAVCFLLITAMRPARSPHSRFELKRRGDDVALERERMLGHVLALRRYVLWLLVVPLSIFGFLLWQQLGVLAVIILLLAAPVLARLKPVHRLAMRIYDMHEVHLLAFCAKSSFVRWLMPAEEAGVHDQKLESPEQLAHLIKSAGHVLTRDQQTLLRNGLDWHQVPVSAVMTPRDEIASVGAGELLGPLVLNDLHQTGHTVFPVTKKNLDHIIGVLDIAEQLRVDKSQSSQTAEKAMTPDPVTVLEDAPLPVALQLLQSTRASLLIVTGDDDKTTGLVTLSDILGALLGKSV